MRLSRPIRTSLELLPEGDLTVYRPPHFQENDPATLDSFIDAHALATLVAASATGLVANHIPLLRLRTPTGGTVLHGHVARANEFWKIVPSQSPVLAIFGGAHHYISPAWYPTKQQSGEVVPTWNYLVVHAHGRIRFIDDTRWLRVLVEALTDRHEAGRPAPWAITDAPPAYVDRMLRAIVGFEIDMERVEGKFKSSQNRTEPERRGAAAGLADDGVSDAETSELVRARD
jgi:transcriptional regulator